MTTSDKSIDAVTLEDLLSVYDRLMIERREMFIPQKAKCSWQSFGWLRDQMNHPDDAGQPIPIFRASDIRVEVDEHMPQNCVLFIDEVSGKVSAFFTDTGKMVEFDTEAYFRKNTLVNSTALGL